MFFTRHGRPWSNPTTRLGRPNSVYKNHFDCCFLEFWVEMAKWPWRSRSMTSIFNTGQENPKMHIWCKFADYSSNPLKVIVWKSWILSNSKAKWPKWPWRSRSMTPSSIQRRIYGENLVILAQMWDKLSCRQCKVYGQTDGRTDTGNDNTPSAWKAKG